MSRSLESFRHQLQRKTCIPSYYHKFISSYASIEAPLSDLAKKCNPQVVNWRPECEEAIHRLKEALCVPSVLTSPALKQPFIIQTDTSVKLLGRRPARAPSYVPKQKILTTRAEICHSREAGVPYNCLGHPVPASLPPWPRVYYPVISPCFTMVGQNKGQECQTDKMEIDVAELQVRQCSTSQEGRIRMLTLCPEPSSMKVYDFVELKTLINFVRCLC